MNLFQLEFLIIKQSEIVYQFIFFLNLILFEKTELSAFSNFLIGQMLKPLPANSEFEFSFILLPFSFQFNIFYSLTYFGVSHQDIT